MRTMLVILLAANIAKAEFTHKRHAELNLKCTFCHKGAETAERATFPGWKTCNSCHAEWSEQAIPSRRVYKVPDFVFFSHGRHAAGDVACAACPGAVEPQAVFIRLRGTKLSYYV